MVVMSHRYGHVDALTQREAMSRLDRVTVPTMGTTEPTKIEHNERSDFLTKPMGSPHSVLTETEQSPQISPQSEPHPAS